MITFNKDQFISKYITKRSNSLFAQDWATHNASLNDEIRNKKLLVIGGAGSIGSHFIKSILEFKPTVIVVIDHNENGLTELTRDLRSTAHIEMPEIFRTYPINFGHSVFEKILQNYKFDIVANFAAHKHVRSEKDHLAIEAMIENNVFFVDEMLRQLRGIDVSHTFCVSTDKAANPVNVMGASKLLMEHVIRSHTVNLKITTARFANVAFSNGSLLDGFIYRMLKRQPLSAPSDVKRYFVSPSEAGQLCVMTCVLGGSGEIYFPKISQEEMMTFSDIAEMFLAELGLKPYYCASAEEAKLYAQNMPLNHRKYPVYFFTSDTSGEKQYEEFYTQFDDVSLDHYEQLGVLRTTPVDETELNGYLNELKLAIHDGDMNKLSLVELLKKRLPGFEHLETGRSLDDKM